MTATDFERQIIDAYYWHRALGNSIADGSHCRFVHNVETPDIWVANHVQYARAATASEIAAMLEEMNAVFAHCDHRMVMTDTLTPDTLIAALGAAGYSKLDSTIQMLLAGPPKITPAKDITFRTVQSDADWDDYYRLVRRDHDEGKKSFHMEMPEAVTRALVADTRRKTDFMTVYLAELDNIPVAYGAGIDCPNGMAMIEDLFTLPEHRDKGIISALMAHAIHALRQADPARPVFLGALAQEDAQHLYRRMGFEPVVVMREFILGQG